MKEGNAQKWNYWWSNPNKREKNDCEVTECMKRKQKSCVLSHVLFNILSEQIFMKYLLHHTNESISIDEIQLHIRHADGAMIFADSLHKHTCTLLKNLL